MNNLRVAEQLIKRAEGVMDEYNKPLKKDLSTKHFHDIVSRAMTQTEDKLDINILRLKDEYGEPPGWTVAHEMANGGYKFTNPVILKITDDDGDTVQDVMNE